MCNEIWKDITGHEGRYMVSNMGRIYSIITDIILKQSINDGGYYIVGLYKNGKTPVSRVHRLMAIEFIPNPLNKPQINHIDGNKLNNDLSNLEWMTNRENCAHARELGLVHVYKTFDDYDIDMIRAIYPTLNIAELAALYGISISHTCAIINYRWRNQ